MSGAFRRAIPSILSASRIVIAIPGALLILDGEMSSRLWAGALFLVGMVTDFLDGYLARKLDVVSDLGKVIDPVSDKIAIGIIFIALLLAGEVEMWVAVIVIGRDILLMAGALYIRSRRHVVVQSNMSGKIAVSALGVLALLCILDVPSLLWFREVTLWFAVAMVFVSLGIYAKRIFAASSEATGASA